MEKGNKKTIAESVSGELKVIMPRGIEIALFLNWIFNYLEFRGAL
jgi:hypothetical protein